MSPAVSIVVPTYNRLQFLPATIASVFAQTFTDWELLIADDGSDALTRDYLHSLEDFPRVQVLRLSHSGRPAVARNAALRLARGEYIAFLDSDDLWLPAKLATQIDSLRAHPERRWSYTRFALIDACGNSLPGLFPLVRALPSGWIIEKLLGDGTTIALPSVLAARNLIDELGGFDEQLTMCEDDELWFRLAAQAQIDAVDSPLTVVRRHAQHSGSDVIAWQDRRRVFQKSLRNCRDDRIAVLLRSRCAEMSAGLARSQAAAGHGFEALRTLAASAAHSWQYPRGWLLALASTLRSFIPQALRALLRRPRFQRPVHGS